MLALFVAVRLPALPPPKHPNNLTEYIHAPGPPEDFIHVTQPPEDLLHVSLHPEALVAEEEDADEGTSEKV
jgi:hypothetical protein